MEHGLLWAFIFACLALMAWHKKIMGLIVGVFSRLEQKGLLGTTFKSWLKADLHLLQSGLVYYRSGYWN